MKTCGKILIRCSTLSFVSDILDIHNVLGVGSAPIFW
jgi:hypothetical protein